MAINWYELSLLIEKGLRSFLEKIEPIIEMTGYCVVIVVLSWFLGDWEAVLAVLGYLAISAWSMVQVHRT